MMKMKSLNEYAYMDPYSESSINFLKMLFHYNLYQWKTYMNLI